MFYLSKNVCVYHIILYYIILNICVIPRPPITEVIGGLGNT